MSVWYRCMHAARHMYVMCVIRWRYIHEHVVVLRVQYIWLRMKVMCTTACGTVPSITYHVQLFFYISGLINLFIVPVA